MSLFERRFSWLRNISYHGHQALAFLVNWGAIFFLRRARVDWIHGNAHCKRRELQGKGDTALNESGNLFFKPFRIGSYKIILSKSYDYGSKTKVFIMQTKILWKRLERPSECQGRKADQQEKQALWLDLDLVHSSFLASKSLSVTSFTILGNLGMTPCLLSFEPNPRLSTEAKKGKHEFKLYVTMNPRLSPFHRWSFYRWQFNILIFFWNIGTLLHWYMAPPTYCQGKSALKERKTPENCSVISADVLL